MNMYFNFAIMAICVTVSLVISLRLLKLRSENSTSSFLSLNAISLLILNAVCWIVTVFITSEENFIQFPKAAVIATALIAFILPLIEMKYRSFEKYMFLLYTFTGFGIAWFSFDMAWQEILLVGIFWGAFTYLFDPFNGEERIAGNAILFMLFGILFLNIFFPTTLGIIFLALITALCLVGFNMASKNELVSLPLSASALHGFAFLTGMFFVYITSLGYFVVALIIPSYFIMERIIYFITVSFKKIFKKESPTLYFFEKALDRGANHIVLNKYIMTFVCLLVMAGSIYDQRLMYLLLACAIFVSLKMIFDMHQWGIRRPTLKETWKTAITDVKIASQEVKSNLKQVSSKIRNKKDK